MFELSVNVSRIEVTKPDILTSGRVGHKVHFHFANNWEGLTKIAVFEAGERSRIVDITENDEIVTIPWEVLEFPDLELKVAVRGSSSNSQVVIPTIYVSLGYILRGADITGGLSASLEPYTLDSLANAIEEMKLNKITLTTEKQRLKPEFNRINPTTYKIDKEPEEILYYPDQDNPSNLIVKPLRYLKINLNNIPISWAEKHIDELYIGVEHFFGKKGRAKHWEKLQDTDVQRPFVYGIAQHYRNTKNNTSLYEEWLEMKPDWMPNNGLLQAKIRLSIEDIERGYIYINPYIYFIPMFNIFDNNNNIKMNNLAPYNSGHTHFVQPEEPIISYNMSLSNTSKYLIRDTLYTTERYVNKFPRNFRFNLYQNNTLISKNENIVSIGWITTGAELIELTSQDLNKNYYILDPLHILIKIK